MRSIIQQNQGNIHLFLANPDGPWRHSNTELDPKKIIISKRRDHRVKEKIQDILEEMIDSVIDTVSPPEIISEDDEGNSGSDDEEMSSGDEDSEDSEDTKAFKELLPSLTCQFCDKLFSNHSNKLRHESFKHGASGNSWAEHCQIDPSCKKVYSNATALRYHQLKAHGKALKCGKCSLEFNDYKEACKARQEYEVRKRDGKFHLDANSSN